MAYEHAKVPAAGAKVEVRNGELLVPDLPVIPFIEGDGTRPDIWHASVRVLDAAVEKAYAGKRKIQWMEVYAGQKSFTKLGSWLPDETVAAFREFLVGIKGPLTTPIGGGIRSLNVALPHGKGEGGPLQRVRRRRRGTHGLRRNEEMAGSGRLRPVRTRPRALTVFVGKAKETA